MKLVIDRGALEAAETELLEAQEKMFDKDASKDERSVASRKAIITYRGMLEVVCRCVRVVP